MISSSNCTFLKIRTLSAALIISGITIYSGMSYADQAYGPVRANDTLSKIVNRYYVGPKRSSISLMREIVERNPQAFVRGDMNLLKRHALLSLPGNDWLVNEKTFATPAGASIAKLANTLSVVEAPSISVANKPSNKLNVQDRLVFLEAERESLISQVAQLKRDNVRLQEQVRKLEQESKASDEQLRLLDAEIIRLTKLLKNNQGLSVSLSQVEELQQQLLMVREETLTLKAQLEVTQTELSNNQYIKKQADITIAQLTKENEQLNAIIEDSQPGVHFFGDESESSNNISLLSGKFKVPDWGVIAGGALLSLIVIALLSTRRKESEISLEVVVEEDARSDNTLEDLLESDQSTSERGFTQTVVAEPEENVYKMFDEGSLEMDLKLDMAKAYLEVSDFKSARLVLEEVLEGGSELQRRQASRLMKQAA